LKQKLVVLKTQKEVKDFLSSVSISNNSIGFVPTMGALHDGHLSLINRSVNENDFTICSIFVNPTQFNNDEDLAKYPRTPISDLEKLNKTGCTAVFIPSVEEMYPTNELLNFDLGTLDLVMEGLKRPGHFRGVVTIVKKLFDLIKPTKAYFGLKDFQQVAVIKKLVNDLRLPVQIVACPTLREADGLALSSRNVRLNAQEREEALKIYKTLLWIKQNKGLYNPELLMRKAIELLTSTVLKPEYVEIVNPENLQTIKSWEEVEHPVACIAVWCGNTRLIDNLEL
jgi:pantoate--beta-alanine ligase